MSDQNDEALPEGPKKVFDSDLMRELSELERRKLRPMAELLLNPADEAARGRLQQLEAAMETLRARLSSRRGAQGAART